MPLDYLSYFALVLRGMLHIKLIIVFTQNFSLILKSYSTWKYNIQANESITKIKEKLSIIQFVSFFHSNVPDYKCHRVASGTCYFLHALN